MFRDFGESENYERNKICRVICNYIAEIQKHQVKLGGNLALPSHLRTGRARLPPSQKLTVITRRLIYSFTKNYTCDTIM